MVARLNHTNFNAFSRLAGAVGLVAALAASFAAGCSEEAGGGLSQVDATPTLPGLCPPGAVTCDDEGATECSGAGLRACVESGGCLSWGVVVACAPGSTCAAGDGGAACVASCEGSACTVPEARRCAPGEAASFQRCVDDGAGCLTWSAPSACPEGQVCGQGGSCGDECADECAAGARRCEGDAVVSCGDHDDDACLEWGAPEPCAAACAIGACVEACQDECATPGLRRCVGDAVEVCVEGAGGCHVWAAAESCAPGTTCSAGRCAVDCVDECAEGAVTCDAGGVVLCGERDGDGCRDRGLPVACPDGQSCSEGACVAIGECADECQEDERRCDESGLAVLGCGQHDADACREWAAVEQCEAGASCSLGRCVAGCEDECEVDARRCRPGSTTEVEACRADGDGDACREWVVALDCASEGEVCAQGACAGSCVDDCAGASVCSGDAVVPCGDFDADACRDLGTPTPCPDAETCLANAAGAVCAPRPAPGGMKIAELLYNSPGDDDDTFIELGGEPGTDLAGFVLEAVNGDGGQTYRTLALGGVVPADGRYVIVHPQARPDLLAVADDVDAFADLQNGPDNLVLRWGDAVVDAVGYGDFHGGDTFVGEGESAPSASSGQALARIGDLQDTDDNRADFVVVPAATPGGPFVAALRPGAFGDVVISEVMADPKLRADNVGEWFEVMNPSAATTWNLEGCEVVSEDGEEHTIDEELLVPPGGRVVLARSADPGGFAPDYVYSGIVLSNDLDLVGVACGGVLVDDFAWLETAPNGKSMSVDPSFEDALVNDDIEAWCPAPVDGAPGADAATPGEKNPPCPNQSGVYAGSALDTTWGACDETPNWQGFVFESAPTALDAGTLSFEWWAVLCTLYAPDAEIWVELETGGGTWVEVAHATLTNGLEACSWLDATASVPKSVINAARAQSGQVQGRFRIEGGCPAGVGCGLLGEEAPHNCGRSFVLSYPY